ncbi:MAG TPA: MupA/Atu3671 family FMN-dependent luciferase-like monooxygenase [Blastocatellia bacterium]|nr:MupA/Atu3671 family FMN-dependent luciferase-like monooxygenase [Blastocatellia bacterium]
MPLSFAQLRLWFLDQFNPGSASYNVPAAARLDGAIDLQAFERAISEILVRHEALRTTFAMIDDQPAQIVAPAQPARVVVHDLSGLPETEREAEVSRRIVEEAQKPFDLGQAPLLRVQALRLGAEDHVVLLTMHHIVSDGWSMNILLREMTILYEAYAQGRPSPLPNLPIQYADYAIWQREYLVGEVLEKELGYWREQLDGAPAVLELPTDRPRPPVQSFRGSWLPLVVEAELAQQIKKLCQQEKVTTFMALLGVFDALLYRYSGQRDIVVGTPIAGRKREETEPLIGFFLNTLALRAKIDPKETFRGFLGQVREVCLAAYAYQDLPFEKLVEELQPDRNMSHSPFFQVMFILQTAAAQRETANGAGALRMRNLSSDSGTSKFDLTLSLVEGQDAIAGMLEYNLELYEKATAERMIGHYLTLLGGVGANPDQPIYSLPLLSPSELDQIIHGWNLTARPFPHASSLGQLFSLQAARSPQATALISHDQSLTYAELEARANQAARFLRRRGVGAESLVGLCVDRSAEMVVWLLAIVKAGCAYVPLDPGYPGERLRYMVEDARVKVVVAGGDGRRTFEGMVGVEVVDIVEARGEIGSESDASLEEQGAGSESVVYVIYTSGSTGRPKGVMISHRNLMNFFAGMDDVIGGDQPGVWLAVTSISFDISVLEIFWTLTRGFEVVILGDQRETFQLAGIPDEVSSRKIDFSLMYFASNDRASGEDIYDLLIEGARFADQHGFSAVWTPERHFHAFGGIYPNPSVITAALAAITKHIQLRAGSVVLPLHDPVRVAEEWAVVDNLSRGRVAVSFASGWHANDFAFRPENYGRRHEVMYRDIEVVRQLWRGDKIKRKNGAGGEIEIQTLPRPVQQELPIWITAAGGPETFRRAGAMGAGLLTHLLTQSIDELKGKLEIYRTAWRENGHPGDGYVTLMLHTFVESDMEYVRDTVREPFTAYLKSSLSLTKELAQSLGVGSRSEEFTEDDVDALLAHAFNRYFETSALMGTPESCLLTINRLKTIGVDEVACLIDFGVEKDRVLASLPHLDRLRALSNARPDEKQNAEDNSLVAWIDKRHVTHLQCTPSLMRMLSVEPETLGKLQKLRKLFLGGEALPVALANNLREILPGEIHNMYGPTETTIWSTTHALTEPGETVPIGRPIANTQIRILDEYLQPTPVGISGESYIGGEGVARGYLNRPDLTAERFLPDPYATQPGQRVYRTGDRARFRHDGSIEFLGRVDQQLKIRGFRIEPGEIEVILEEYPRVEQAVVVARPDRQGELQLVAYIVWRLRGEGSIKELRGYAQERLPEHLRPGAYVELEAMPLTPNGKVDRGRLPEVTKEARDGARELVGARTPTEEILVEIWREVLRVEHVGVHDNFFELGGHSLLATLLVSRVRKAFSVELPLRNAFDAPTVAGLAIIIEQKQLESIGSDVLARMSDEIKHLSDEDLAALLEAEKQQLVKGAD